MNAQRLAELTELFLEEALSGADEQELLGELQRSPQSLQVFRETLSADYHLREAGSEARYQKAFWLSVRDRIGAIGDSHRFSGAVMERLTGKKKRPRRKTGPFAWPLIAACIAFAIIWGIVAHKRPPAIAIVAAASSTAEILREGESRATPLEALAEIHSGDRIDSSARNGTVQLRYINEATLLRLNPDSSAKISLIDGAKRIDLTSGSIFCDAATQPAGKPLTIVTPHATATVVGTKFSLRVYPASTRLEVEHGAVEFTRNTDHQTAVVRDQQFADAEAAPQAAALVVQSSAEAVGSQAPAAPAWKELFNGKDLHGWSVIRGTWTCEDGVVKGIESRGKLSPKIVSNDSFGNFELTAFVRVSGANYGELQLRDNNWQFPIEHGGIWHELRAVAKGTSVRAWLDGAPLAPEADAGDPDQRIGPIGLFAAVNAVLEIKNLRLRRVDAASKSDF